jgi:predicted dinucleotide-binding enzyme
MNAHEASLASPWSRLIHSKEVRMKVAVIGAGRMGGGIARALARKHEVSVRSRDPYKAASFATEIGAARGTSYSDAAKEAEMIFLTIPWPAVDETLPQLGDLAGKVVVEVTNPYVGGALTLHENSSKRRGDPKEGSRRQGGEGVEHRVLTRGQRGA